MSTIILGALGAIRLVLLGALPASAARWVALILSIAEVVVPLVERFTSEEFRDLSGGRKGRAVVITVRKALDTADDLLWASLSEERKDGLLNAVKEIALFMIDAANGTLDRKAATRPGKAQVLQPSELSDLAVAAATLLSREPVPVRLDDGQR